MSPQSLPRVNWAKIKDKAQAAATGRTARAAGDHAEAMFERACAFYAEQGKAYVTKRPTPVKQIGPMRNGQFLAVYEKSAGCDYYGALDGGRAVMVELKSSSTTNLPLQRRGEDTIKEVQAAELATVTRLGGTAMVVVRLNLMWWALTWRDWLSTVQYAQEIGAKSLNAKALDAYGKRLGVLPNGGPDWLWWM